MTALILALLALAAGIHWLRCNPNRDYRGPYKPNNVVERRGVYVVLAVAAALVLLGCAATNKVERYQDAYGTVERTTHPDGSVSVRYVP